MVGYSRPQKFIREVSGVASLGEAEQLRRQPFWLVVHEDAAARMHVLVRALVATAVRATSGTIHVRAAGTEEFRQQVTRLMEIEARAYGCEERVISREFNADENAGPGISIGAGLANLTTVDASGLYSAVNRVFFKDAVAPHAAAACFAAALGFAKYFSGTILKKPKATDESWVFSLSSFTPADPTETDLKTPIPNTNLREIHLLGAGAIGSAFCFSMNLSGDRANLEIVDKERYEEPNQETTYFLTRREAIRYPPKADALAEYARREGLKITPRPMKTIVQGDDYLARHSDVFACAVDNVETRGILDSCNTGVLINAGLGGTRFDAGHALVTWHKAGVKTLAEVYPKNNNTEAPQGSEPPKEITNECSRLAYESVSLAAPFMALASGALLHALCRANALEQLPEAYYTKLDLLGRQQAMITRTCLPRHTSKLAELAR